MSDPLILDDCTFTWSYQSEGAIGNKGGVCRLGFTDEGVLILKRRGRTPRAVFKYATMVSVTEVAPQQIDVGFRNGALLTLAGRRGSQVDAVVKTRIQQAIAGRHRGAGQ
jgi:hypothetical protein